MDNNKIITPDLKHAKTSDWLNVYEPAEDTFLMLDTLENEIEFIQSMRPRICLEVGSGAGIIITAVSRLLGATSHCLAIDINRYACLMSKTTAFKNNVSVDVLQADLTSCIRKNSIDMIMFNPPYVVTPSEELKGDDMLAKSWAGGIKGREVIDQFLSTLDRCLNSKSFGYILLLKENQPDEVINILKQKLYQCKIINNRKLRGEELCILKFQKM